MYIYIYKYIRKYISLVVSTPLENMKVSWDGYSRYEYMEK